MLSLADAQAEGAQVLSGGDREEVCVVTAGWYQLETTGLESANVWDALKLRGSELGSASEPTEGLDTGFDEVPLFYVPNREDKRQPWALPEGGRGAAGAPRAAAGSCRPEGGLLPRPVSHPARRKTPLRRPGCRRRAGFSTRRRRRTSPPLSKTGGNSASWASEGSELLMKHEGFLVQKALPVASRQ